MNPSLIPIITVKPPSPICTGDPATPVDILLAFIAAIALAGLVVAIPATIEWLDNRRN